MYQTADLEIVEGDSTTLHCYWRANSEQKFKVNWKESEIQPLHHPTAVRYDGEGCGSTLSPVNNGACGWATLTLPNVTLNRAGRYVCQVTMERPTYNQFWGSGTMITVTERQSPTNGTTQESRLFLSQSLALFLFQTKNMFSLVWYQNLVVHSNIRQDRLGFWGFQRPAEW